MKLHYMAPSVPIGSELSDAQVRDETLVEQHIWYNGLRSWNRPGRLVERVTVSVTPSMQTFIDEMARHMAGTEYVAHIIQWDGQLPLLNLCVFDMNQVLITFSTSEGQDPYTAIAGLRIKSPEVAEYLYREYYKPLVAAGCRQPPGVFSA